MSAEQRTGPSARRERLRRAAIPPGDEIRQRARERSRTSVRSGRERLVVSARPIVHTSVAAALEARDGELAERALVRARDIDEPVVELSEAVEAARESARISIRPRRSRDEVRSYADSVRNLELAVRNVRVIARGAMRAISLEHRTPPELRDALRHLAEAVQGIGPALADGGADTTEEAQASRAAGAARRAAADANAAMERTGNLSALHLIAQVRSTAVDLQRALGIDRAAAVEGVRAGETGDEQG